MKRFVIALLSAAVLSVAGGALHPAGDPKRDASPIQGPPADAETREILERSCANCHSEQVRWPWYNRLAPASWLLEHDVTEARAHMNFSGWNRYTAQEQEALLAAIGVAARTGAMPPRRFTLLHPDAVLTPQQRQHIYEWSRAQRRTLRTRSPLAISQGSQ
jgi:hypothetical protein